MRATDPTPSTERDIVYRRMQFQMEKGTPRYWHSNSPYITHFYTALSMSFPEGEKFFIESVKAFEHQITDPVLRRQVAAFAQQEAQHSVQHRVYNDVVVPEDAHDIVERSERIQRRRLALGRRFASDLSMLAATTALEHFTAAFSHQVLGNPEITRGMHESVKPLWVWHCIEETEHKAVAFDVYQAVGGGYWRRALAMARVTLFFPFALTVSQVRLLVRDGKLFDFRDFLRYLKYILGRNGLLRCMWPDLMTFFRRDFHPWQQDNYHLVQKWRSEYEPYVLEAHRTASA